MLDVKLTACLSVNVTCNGACSLWSELQVEHAVSEAAESCQALHDEWQATVPLLKSLSKLAKHPTGQYTTPVAL
jgi:hypothetical protein